jgi:hypothetical protein
LFLRYVGETRLHSSVDRTQLCCVHDGVRGVGFAMCVLRVPSLLREIMPAMQPGQKQKSRPLGVARCSACLLCPVMCRTMQAGDGDLKQ